MTSWFGRLASVFRPRDAGTIDIGDLTTLSYRQHLNASEAGMHITMDEALRVSPVWCAMDTIVRAIAPCPWNVYEVQGRKRDLRPSDSLTYLLNTRANSWTTAIAFREALLWSALGYGNGYAEIQYDSAGRIEALWNLDPERVIPVRDPVTGDLAYRVLQQSGDELLVEPRRIYHLRGSSRNGVRGENVMARAARSIASAAAAQQFAAAYFANGTVLSGYFSYPKTLDPATKETLEKDWKDKHSGGPGAKHKSPILPPGMEFHQLSSDPGKAQLLETRQFSVPDVARWFGVPLHLLMDPQGSQGYGTNIEQSGTQFVNGTLHAWAERHEQEADFKLLPLRPASRETRIDLSRHSRGVFDTRMTGYATAKKAGILSQNEIREMEGWNTTGPDGDVYFLETSLQPVERAIEPPPEPAPSVIPGAQPEEPTPAAAPVNMRPAVIAMFARELERYTTRVAKRDAAKAGKADPLRDAAVEGFRAELAKDCEDALLTLGRIDASARTSHAVEMLEQGRTVMEAAGWLADGGE